MEATEWIIVLVVVLVAAALVAWLVTQQRKNKQQEHAEHLRGEAHEHAAAIPETQDRAKEAEAKAEVARLEAERAAQQTREAQVAATQQQAVHEDRLRTADQVDPRVDTTSGDYTPQVGGTVDQQPTAPSEANLPPEQPTTEQPATEQASEQQAPGTPLLPRRSPGTHEMPGKPIESDGPNGGWFTRKDSDKA